MLDFYGITEPRELGFLSTVGLEEITHQELVRRMPDSLMQHRYNIMESKLNSYISSFAQWNNKEKTLERIKELTKMLPTQTVRSTAKDSLQQFSTPLHLAYFMTELLNLEQEDIILDPSAGTGNLLTFVMPTLFRKSLCNGTHCKYLIYANEIDRHRAGCLTYTFRDVRISHHNAEFIHNLLPEDIKPNKIIMNPPFSAGLKTSKNKSEYGYKHLKQAFYRLEEGGRLVLLLGEFCMNHTTFWKEFATQPNITIKANYTVPRGEYAKNGTSYGMQIIVIDKVAGDSTTSLKNFYNPKLYSTKE